MNLHFKSHAQISKSHKNNFIENLSLKSLKLKADCLFSKQPKLKSWDCDTVINSEHVVEKCPLTADWRILWNTRMWSEDNKSILEFLSSSLSFEKWNSSETAKRVNEAVEELFQTYLNIPADWN